MTFDHPEDDLFLRIVEEIESGNILAAQQALTPAERELYPELASLADAFLTYNLGEETVASQRIEAVTSLQFHPAALILRLKLALNRGDRDRVERLLKEADRAGPAWLASYARILDSISIQQWDEAYRLAWAIVRDGSDSNALAEAGFIGFVYRDTALLRTAGYHVGGHPKSRSLRAARLMAAILDKNKTEAQSIVHEFEGAPTSPGYLGSVALARYHEWHGHWGSAIEVIASIRDELGKDYDMYCLMARAHLKLGRFEGALEWTKLAQQYRAHGVEAFRIRFIALLRLRRMREALTAFREWRGARRRANPGD